MCRCHLLLVKNFVTCACVWDQGGWTMGWGGQGVGPMAWKIGQLTCSMGRSGRKLASLYKGNITIKGFLQFEVCCILERGFVMRPN
jgi:hypothetical protein